MNRPTTLLRQRRRIALAMTSAVAALSFSPQASAAGVTTTAGTYVGFSRGCDVLYTAGSGSLQIGNGSNNVPCPASSYNEDVSTDGLSGARITYSGTVDSTGAATSVFGHTHETLFRDGPSNGAFADAYTAANLADGTLRVHAQGGTVYVGQGGEGAVATARFVDGLNFNVAGAAADAVTAIGVHYTLEGHVVAGGFASSNEDLYAAFGLGNAGFAVSAFGRGFDPFAITSHDTEHGWASFSYSALDPTHVAFDGIYNLLGSTQTLRIEAYLSAGAAFADLDYGNTLRVSFTLPGNVSYTSDSGVFLSATNPVTPVPEPETWALMLAGLGLTGHLARRRRAA